MDWIRTNWNSLKEKVSRYSLQLTLILGLRRLDRWKSRLLLLLRAIRLDRMIKQEGSQELLHQLNLPQVLPVPQETLLWALVTLEDLYLLLLDLEMKMQALLSTLKQP